MVVRLCSLEEPLLSDQSTVASQDDLALSGKGSAPLYLQPLGWVPSSDDRPSIGCKSVSRRGPCLALSDQRSGHGHPVHPPSPALPFPLEASIGMWRGWGPHLQGSKILRWDLQPRPGAGQRCQGSLLEGCTWLPPLCAQGIRAEVQHRQPASVDQNKSHVRIPPATKAVSPCQLFWCVCMCARAYVTRSHVAQAALNLLWG